MTGLGDGSEESFLAAIKALPFMDTFRVFLSAIRYRTNNKLLTIHISMNCGIRRGDLEAIERVAYELCEMQAREGAIYSEVHYPPHYLLPESFHSESTASVLRTSRETASNVYHMGSASSVPSRHGQAYRLGPWLAVNGYQQPAVKREMTIRDVVDAVNRGLAHGQRDFKVTIRSVLTLIRTKPQWSADIVNVAIETRQHGVVGIDMIGDVFGITSAPNEGTSQNG